MGSELAVRDFAVDIFFLELRDGAIFIRNEGERIDSPMLMFNIVNTHLVFLIFNPTVVHFPVHSSCLPLVSFPLPRSVKVRVHFGL